jgi:para-nitrobenzyl esterase
MVAKYSVFVLAVAAGVLGSPRIAASRDTNIASALAGSSWSLVAITTTGDKTTTPDDGSKYTINFGADRRAQIRSDCNRGVASWHSPEDTDLEFGRIRMTRVKCQEGSMDGRFVSDLGSVRSYSFEKGHLYLRLAADGGVLEFEPHAP